MTGSCFYMSRMKYGINAITFKPLGILLSTAVARIATTIADCIERCSLISMRINGQNESTKFFV